MHHNAATPQRCNVETKLDDAPSQQRSNTTRDKNARQRHNATTLQRGKVEMKSVIVASQQRCNEATMDENAAASQRSNVPTQHMQKIFKRITMTDESRFMESGWGCYVNTCGHNAATQQRIQFAAMCSNMTTWQRSNGAHTLGCSIGRQRSNAAMPPDAALHEGITTQQRSNAAT